MNRCWRGDGVDSLAEGAIADLIVVLHERDEGIRRKITGGFSATSIGRLHDLALKGEPFSQSSSQLAGVVLVVTVIAMRLECRSGVQDVMHVVVPLGREGFGLSALFSGKTSSFIGLILED